MSGANLIVWRDMHQCRACKNERQRRARGTKHPQHTEYRTNAPGKLMARGPLDYDHPVTVRCAHCGGVFERPLAEIGNPCPHCFRYPEAAA